MKRLNTTLKTISSGHQLFYHVKLRKLDLDPVLILLKQINWCCQKSKMCSIYSVVLIKRTILFIELQFENVVKVQL